MWCASLGPGSSHTLHGNAFTLAKCLRATDVRFLLFNQFPKSRNPALDNRIAAHFENAMDALCTRRDIHKPFSVAAGQAQALGGLLVTFLVVVWAHIALTAKATHAWFHDAAFEDWGSFCSASR
jgi:hypothetical protein